MTGGDRPLYPIGLAWGKDMASSADSQAQFRESSRLSSLVDKEVSEEVGMETEAGLGRRMCPLS